MSPHAVNSFVNDLVAMAKAVEDLPKVQSDLDTACTKIDALERTVQDRELAIIDYKATITDLQSQLRNAEVSRDDAELRFLEVEDKQLNILAMAKAARASLEQMTTLLDPPKPLEPAKQANETQRIDEEGHGQVVQPIVQVPAAPNPFATDSVKTEAELGQSVPDPTRHTTVSTEAYSPVALNVETPDTAYAEPAKPEDKYSPDGWHSWPSQS